MTQHFSETVAEVFGICCHFDSVSRIIPDALRWIQWSFLAGFLYSSLCTIAQGLEKLFPKFGLVGVYSAIFDVMQRPTLLFRKRATLGALALQPTAKCFDS